MRTMTKKEARDLEARFTTPDESPIRPIGTVTITDAESNTTQRQLLYPAKDILQYLSRGYSINKVLDILDKQSRVAD